MPFIDMGPDVCKHNSATMCMHADKDQHLKHQPLPFFSISIRASEYFIAPKYTRAWGILHTGNSISNVNQSTPEPGESCTQVTV